MLIGQLHAAFGIMIADLIDHRAIFCSKAIKWVNISRTSSIVFSSLFPLPLFFLPLVKVFSY